MQKGADVHVIMTASATQFITELTLQGRGGQPTIVDLVKHRHTVIVELDPPRDLDIAKFMKGAETLKAAGADALTLADNSLAVTRMSNMALGHLVQDRTGLRPLVHIACRDRNLIGTQSHMMGRGFVKWSATGRHDRRATG